MQLYRTKKMAITVRLSFVVFVLAYALLINAGFWGTLVSFPIILFVLILHELGHAIPAYCMGESSEIAIGGAGGETILHGKTLHWWQHSLILIGGTVTSALLAYGLWFLDPVVEPMSEFVRDGYITLYNLNFLWMFCNVLPLFPFDGGRLMLVVGNAIFGRLGQKAAMLISILFGALISIYCFYASAFLGILVALYCIVESFSRFRDPSYSKDELSSADALFRSLEERWKAGDQEHVLDELRHLSRDSSELRIRQRALRICADCLRHTFQTKEAYELLASTKDPLSIGSLELLAEAAYETAHWEKGLEAGRAAYREAPSFPLAVLCSRMAARLELDEEAIGWLKAALSYDSESASEIIEDEDFDAIRTSAVFSEFIKHG